MDAERRREILHDMLGTAASTPPDLAGPEPLTIAEMAAVARIESGLAADLATRMEIGVAVQAALDRDLADQGGGWRYPTRVEQRGDEAAVTWSVFASSKSWD